MQSALLEASAQGFARMDGLDIARGLFLAHGALWILIGILAPIMRDSNIGTGIAFSGRSDAPVFGDEPRALLADPRIRILRGIFIDMMAGLLVAAGILVAAVGWFALPSTWALVALTMVCAGVIPFWWLAARPLWRAGARITLADAPPLMWVPFFLDIPALALGWVGH